jgi:hypothetical protein
MSVDMQTGEVAKLTDNTDQDVSVDWRPAPRPPASGTSPPSPPFIRPAGAGGRTTMLSCLLLTGGDRTSNSGSHAPTVRRAECE